MPDPRTVYWIDPMRIHLHTSLKTDSPDWEAWVFAQRGRIRTVQDGEWDVSELRVADMRVCRAVDARINNGASWQSSDYYQTAIRDIEAGRHVFACKDRSDFDRHCVELDKLIESIAKTGYQESSRLDDTASIDSSLGHQEIIVNISREGFPLFQDGRHRLAVARTLKINRIPVQILVRHEEWQAFRSFMQRMARGSGGAAKEGFLYQDPIHFDLGDIPALHGCEDRWEAMSANLPAGSGAALDIGCNLGYFCHGLERKGYSPIGVEYLPDIAYAAQKIARAEKMKFKIVEGDILSDETKVSIGDGEFAVVVAVNIFHHFIKTEAGFKRLERFMKDLNCRTMFFESHHPDDPQMQGAYMNPTPAEFAQKIGEWGRFQFISPIYSAADGRTIFALSR
jgi:SAM-dependent methyltransferase